MGPGATHVSKIALDTFAGEVPSHSQLWVTHF